MISTHFPGKAMQTKEGRRIKAHVIVWGAGLGGIPMAYELKEELREEDRVTVVSDKDRYQFVPSNPWLAVNWRKP